MAGWREAALIITTSIGIFGSAQQLMTLPQAMKKATTPMEAANMGLGAVSIILGTAMSVDFLRRSLQESIAMSKAKKQGAVPVDVPVEKKRNRGVRLGHR